MHSRLYRYGWKIVDFFFPPRCVGCEKWGDRWCESCINQVTEIKEPICSLCGDQLPDDTSWNLCERCRQHRPQYAAIRSWAVFEGQVQKALHALKYERNLGLGEVMANFLCKVFSSTDWKVDLVVPVPLGMERFKKRGYNQAMLLARPFAWSVGIPHIPKALQRVRETRSQVELSILERRENVAGAFKAIPEIVSGKSVLVIDDVTTTGSTLDACADALRRANARQVYGLTLARAVRSQKRK